MPYPIKEGEWQPIETAPKDETLFLGYDPTMPPCSRYDVWRLLSLIGGVYFYMNTHDSNEEWQQPTHWMPLPEPPK